MIHEPFHCRRGAPSASQLHFLREEKFFFDRLAFTGVPVVRGLVNICEAEVVTPRPWGESLVAPGGGPMRRGWVYGVIPRGVSYSSVQYYGMQYFDVDSCEKYR